MMSRLTLHESDTFAAGQVHEEGAIGDRAPLISVIMPVYNGERFLGEAIRSVCDQTLTAIELIVLDDGSSDASGRIAEEHAAEDSRVRVVHLERTGLAGALNEGIRLARGEWVARLDGDDLALPHRLERQYAFIREHPGIGAVGSYGWDIGEHGGAPAGMNRHGPTTEEEYRRQRASGLLSVLTPSLVFRRDLALALGGYRDASSPGEDADFTNRIADDHLVLVIPEPLISYRIHGQSETHNQLVQQMTNLRRAEINSLRRRAGQPEYTWEELDAVIGNMPRRERIRQQLEWRSHACYRRAGSLLATGRPSGVLWLAASGLYYPPLPFRRLRRQRVLALAASRLLRRGDAAAG